MIPIVITPASLASFGPMLRPLFLGEFMFRSTLTFAAALTVAAGAFAQTATPRADSRASSNAAVKDSQVKTASVAADGANSFTEAQARDRITKAGFRQVSGLTKDDAGLWQGTARKGSKSRHVALDYKGNVTSK